MEKILITGNAGFIGSHALKYFIKKYPEYEIHGLDSLTYASNKDNIKDLDDKYTFHQIDIRDRSKIFDIFERERFTDVIHFAAESHVDNSIKNPITFVQTNVIGTVNLLDAFKQYSTGRFHHISTDEVFGHLSLDDPGFSETNPYKPNSPYSASKAASDHFVNSYHKTYGLDIVITNCSNNFGPYQNKEKFVPTVILSTFKGDAIPVYGNGLNIRDWLYVEDHIKAIDLIFHKGRSGESYNIGGNLELTNLQMVEIIGDIIESNYGKGKTKIEFIEDRLGHDFRYSINDSKIKNEFPWNPSPNLFEYNLLLTIDWYYHKYIK